MFLPSTTFVCFAKIFGEFLKFLPVYGTVSSISFSFRKIYGNNFHFYKMAGRKGVRFPALPLGFEFDGYF